MPYRIMSFDGVALPDFNTVDDLGTGEVESSLVDALNGSVDYYGSTRKLPRAQKIPFRGAFVAQNGRLTDGLGRLLLDGNKKYLLPTEQFFTDLQQKTDALKSRLGVLGRLYRQPEGARATVMAKNDALRLQLAPLVKEQTKIIAGAPSTYTLQTINAAIDPLLAQIVDPNSVGLQWKTARLLSVKHSRELKDMDRIATLDMEFQTIMSAWKSDQATHITIPVNGTVDANISTTGSETVNDFIMKITPTTGALTSLRVSVNGSTIYWDSSPNAGSEDVPPRPRAEPVAINTDIVIDMGRETIIIGGADGYANFTSPSALPGWLYFLPGINRMTIEANGSQVNCVISFYDQWT